MSRQLLLQLLADGSDVVLEFRDASGALEDVPAHSLTLRQWSEVLRMAIQAESSGSNSSDRSSSSSSCRIRIPMDGTKKEDWLAVMEFLYPVTPPPVVTWDSLEPLLRIGDKYAMPAFLQKSNNFIQHQKKDLTLDPDSNLFVWKWVHVLDRYGLHTAAKQCIDGQESVAALLGACDQERLSDLSSGTLQHLIKASIVTGWLGTECKGWCPECDTTSKWHYNRSGASLVFNCHMCHNERCQLS